MAEPGIQPRQHGSPVQTFKSYPILPNKTYQDVYFSIVCKDTNVEATQVSINRDQLTSSQQFHTVPWYEA